VSTTGKIIREHRIQAGFTQKALADALHVTDKAISKWERGICLPDVTLLPKLSLLIDVDLDRLILKTIEQEEWVGLIDIHNCDFSQTVYDKPLVYYLLSHFLLLGLTKIHVFTDEENKKYLNSELFKVLGFSFSYDVPKNCRTMILNHPWFLFGSDLTQHFQGSMLAGKNIKLVPENQSAVFYFSYDASSYFKDKKNFCKTASSRTLGRGMLCFDMGDSDKALEVASFVRTYQKNSGLLIGSLEEIAYKKRLVSNQQLTEIAGKVPYREMLLRLGCKPQVD
jgi:transcriptional regulator with XRE-family HTH domain